MASDHPIIPNPLSNDSKRRSQSHETRSRRSSASIASVKAAEAAKERISEEAEPSKRGRKPFEVSEEVDRGLVRVLDSTDVSFDKLAKAVEESGGPRKLWLRRRFKGVTGTNCFGILRLGNDKEAAIQRRQRQQKAMGLSTATSVHQDGLVVQHASTDLTIQESSGTETQMPRVRPNSINTPMTLDRPMEQTQQHFSSFGVGSRMESAEYDQLRQSDARFSATSSTLAGRSSAALTPTKRAFSDETNDVARPDYGTRKDRTRALSLSAIIETLENLTGQTGIYDHIKRVSVKSHISPRFRSFRFSRGSRRASEGSTAPGTSMYEGNSPHGNDSMPVPYEPDPDYANFYHHPTSDRIVQTQYLEAIAVASLMVARTSSMSDENAESHLLKSLPDEEKSLTNCLNIADDKGVTALHLAVAYGYPRVCRYLMQNLANPFAVTNRGSSVCRFARPAQDFAKELSLYHRILYCRQWICAGLAPPVPADSEMDESSDPDADENAKARQAHKRIRTIDSGLTLPTVEETPTEEPAETRQIPMRSSAMMNRETGLAPIITDVEFDTTFGHSLGPAVTDYDHSPISAMRHCLQDHGSIGDVLTPVSFSPNGPLWPTGSAPFAPHVSQVPTGVHSSSQPAEAATQQWDSFGGLNIMANFGPSDHLTPSVSFPSQYNGVSQVTSSRNFDIETALPFNWSSQEFRGTDQILTDPSYLPNASTLAAGYGRHQDQSVGFQEQYEHQAPSRLQYPTPPSESRSMRRQESWQPNGDVSRATALALSDQSSFPTGFWYNDDDLPPTSNHNSFFQHNSSYNFDPNA